MNYPAVTSVAVVCGAVGFVATTYYIKMSVNWKSDSTLSDKFRQFFEKPVQVCTFVTLLSGTLYPPLDCVSPFEQHQSGAEAVTRALAFVTFTICVTTYLWGMKIRSEVLLRESSHYKAINRLVVASTVATWLVVLVALMPLPTDLQDAQTTVGVVLIGMAGLGITSVAVIFTFVYYRFIGSNHSLKYRPVYEVLCRFGMWLSLVNVVGAFAIGLGYVLIDVIYPIITDLDISIMLVSLVAMQHGMKLKQAECDSKAAISAVANAVSVSMQDSPVVQQQTYGNQSTYFDTESRIVAVPAYLQVDLKSFEVDVDILAEGGDAVVKLCTIVDPTLYTQWQVRYKLNSLQIVIKLMRSSEADSPEQQGTDSDRFLQEVSVFSSLQGHENIALFLGYTESPRSMLMAKYDGSLRELIVDTSASIPLISVVQQILTALQEIHRCGITHCDIKPGNLLFKRSQNIMQIVLSDFGIAQVKLAAEKVETRHSVRLDAQSFTYAPPDILHQIMSSDSGSGTGGLLSKQIVAVELSERDNFLLSVGEAEPSRDMYALAIVIWELVARAVCWHNVERNDIYNLVLLRKFRPPHDPSGILQTDVLVGIGDDTLRVLQVAAQNFARGYDQQVSIEGAEPMARLLTLMSGCWCHEPMQRFEAKLALELSQQ